jgi:hypothetical protein
MERKKVLKKISRNIETASTLIGWLFQNLLAPFGAYKHFRSSVHHVRNIISHQNQQTPFFCMKKYHIALNQKK